MLLITAAFAAEPAAPLAPQMHERYALLEEAREAVIHGRLADARAAAKKLAKYRAAALPAEWAPLVEAVNREALALASASDLIDASGRTAQVADACAACHVATHGGPDPAQLAAIPPQGWTEGTNMKLHAWATDVLWFGLLARSDEEWLKGANELAAEPIPLKFPEPPLQEGRTQLELRLYVLAGSARALTTPEERTTLYGQMLETCAECHSAR